MLPAHLTPHLIARAERFQARFHAARMGALADLPGNPFGVEICPFGDGVACKIRHPLLRGKNRIHGFGVADMDALDDLLHFYREDGLPCSLTVVQGGMTEALFTHFGMASFPITDGVGYFGTGGVLPECRRRGIQTALIRRRLADALALGCDLVLGGGSMGTATYRNFEGAGLRLIPTGMHWTNISA